MGKLIFAMSQSLDGYVAGVDGALKPPLHGPTSRFSRSLMNKYFGSEAARRMEVRPEAEEA